MSAVRILGLTALAAVSLSGSSHRADTAPEAWVMVRDGVGLDHRIAALGGTVVRHATSAAFVAVAVPPGVTAERFVQRLRACGHADASVIETIRGTGKGKGKAQTDAGEISPSATTASPTTAPEQRAASTSPTSLDRYQWHLDDIGLRDTAPRANGIVVAVIDSGVAYTDAVQGETVFVAANSLRGVPVVAPWDFVEDDALPLDEHQHGTHIASLIASEGDIRGVAPGVHLMPLRVLDENNAGNELDLVDAMHWAIDNGADVLNLSLSFPTGYLPSVALEEALERAHTEGVVVVAATGNDGANIISWPAASPSSIAVGAASPYPSGVYATPYTNIDPRVSLMAPGGDVAVDANADGYPDGLLAETIALRDPAHVGLWFMEGTSQAAAVTSGAAALLLAQGYAPHDVKPQLQYSARKDWGAHAYAAAQGLGTGSLDAHSAITIGDQTGQHDWMGAYTVAVLPYLERRPNGSVVPHARLTVLDNGEIATWGQVHGSFWGSTESYFVCDIGRLQEGGYHCDVSGPAVPASQDDAAWLVSADLVTAGSGIQRPTAGAFASDELQVIITAMQNDDTLNGGVLGFMWDESRTDEFGAVAEGYTVSDLGSGLLSSPMGLLARPGALTPPSSYALDLDGTGLLSSPMGFQSVRILSFASLGGSGLLSSPMGRFSLPTMVFIDGTGLLSSPMGFSASTLLTADPTGTYEPISLFGKSSTDSEAWTTLGHDSWAHGPSLLVSTDAAQVDDAQSGAQHLPGVPFIP